MATPNPKKIPTGQRGTVKLYELAAKKLKFGELSISIPDIIMIDSELCVVILTHRPYN